MSKDSDKTTCCIGIFSVISLICFFAILASFIIPYVDNQQYEEHICNISKIVVPSDLPSKNNTLGWKTCRCGRRCETYNPCIQLYSSVNPSIVIRENYYDFYGDDPQCTFYDSSCNGNGNILKVEEKLIEAREIYENYYNKSVKCYYNDDKSEIFLEKDYDIRGLVTLGIIFIFSFICLFIHICVYYNDKRKNKIENNIINKFSEN